MGLRNQFLATGAICIIGIGIGIIETWPSYTIELFKSENSTLARPLTETELSLFGSLSSFGSLIATPLISGVLLDKLGRKKLTLFIASTHALTWILRVIFTNVEITLLSCVLSGVGTSGLFVTIIYISECCQESIRGAMTAATNTSPLVGMMVSYWIGGTLDYHTVNYICITLGVLQMALISLMEDSPTYLMKIGLEEDAKKSIAFYRSTNIESDEVIKEINSIKRALNPDFDDIPLESPEVEKLNPESTPKKLTTWQFIKKSRSSRRAFGVCFILALVSIFQGVSPVQVFAVTLFKTAVPNISPTITTVLLALVGLVSALVSGYLTDRSGRRALLIYPSLAGCIFSILLGLQLQILWGPHWLTAVLIYLYCAAYGFGAATIPYILLSEIFLPEIKGLASMLIGETFWVANFVLLFIFNPLVDIMGLAAVFYIFAGICIATAVITYFLLPETKGLPVDEIQLLFAPKRRNSVTSADIKL